MVNVIPSRHQKLQHHRKKRTSRENSIFRKKLSKSFSKRKHFCNWKVVKRKETKHVTFMPFLISKKQFWASSNKTPRWNEVARLKTLKTTIIYQKQPKISFYPYVSIFIRSLQKGWGIGNNLGISWNVRWKLHNFLSAVTKKGYFSYKRPVMHLQGRKGRNILIR